MSDLDRFYREAQKFSYQKAVEKNANDTKGAVQGQEKKDWKVQEIDRAMQRLKVSSKSEAQKKIGKMAVILAMPTEQNGGYLHRVVSLHEAIRGIYNLGGRNDLSYVIRKVLVPIGLQNGVSNWEKIQASHVLQIPSLSTMRQYLIQEENNASSTAANDMEDQLRAWLKQLGEVVVKVTKFIPLGHEASIDVTGKSWMMLGVRKCLVIGEVDWGFSFSHKIRSDWNSQVRTKTKKSLSSGQTKNEFAVATSFTAGVVKTELEVARGKFVAKLAVGDTTAKIEASARGGIKYSIENKIKTIEVDGMKIVLTYSFSVQFEVKHVECWEALDPVKRPKPTPVPSLPEDIFYLLLYTYAWLHGNKPQVETQGIQSGAVILVAAAIVIGILGGVPAVVPMAAVLISAKVIDDGVESVENRRGY